MSENEKREKEKKESNKGSGGLCSSEPFFYLWQKIKN